MSNFDEWFEINKVTSNRSPDMEGLKDLKEEITNLESYIAELEDDYENMKGTVIGIKNLVEESKTLKEAKEKVNDYDYW